MATQDNYTLVLWLRPEGLALIDHNHAAFDHHFGFQPIPIAFQRIAVQKNEVGELAVSHGADVLAQVERLRRAKGI